MNNKSNNSGDCRNEIDEQASTIAALKEQVSTLQAAMGIQKQAIRALASQPAAPLAVSKDVEWLMQCAEEAKCDPDVATKIRAHCIAAAKREASQPAAPVQPQQPLIGVLLASKEQAQRAKMDERSAKRRQHAVASADFDLPAPNDMVDGHADRAQRPSSLAPTVAGSVDTDDEHLYQYTGELDEIGVLEDEGGDRGFILREGDVSALMVKGIDRKVIRTLSPKLGEKITVTVDVASRARLAPAAPSGEAVAYKLQDDEKIFYSRLGQSDDGLPFMTDSDQHGVWDIAMVFKASHKRPSRVFVEPFYTHPAPSSPTAPVQQAQAVPELAKWIDDAKGKDPFTDDLIAEIERLRAQASANTPEGK